MTDIIKDKVGETVGTIKNNGTKTVVKDRYGNEQYTVKKDALFDRKIIEDKFGNTIGSITEDADTGCAVGIIAGVAIIFVIFSMIKTSIQMQIWQTREVYDLLIAGDLCTHIAVLVPGIVLLILCAFFYKYPKESFTVAITMILCCEGVTVIVLLYLREVMNYGYWSGVVTINFISYGIFILIAVISLPKITFHKTNGYYDYKVLKKIDFYRLIEFSENDKYISLSKVIDYNNKSYILLAKVTSDEEDYIKDSYYIYEIKRDGYFKKVIDKELILNLRPTFEPMCKKRMNEAAFSYLYQWFNLIERLK